MTAKQYYHDIDLVNVGQLVGARHQNVTDAEMNTLASSLSSANEGLVVWNSTFKKEFVWNGTTFIPQSAEIDGNVIYKGTVDANLNLDTQAIAAAGYEYIVSAAGTLTMTGVTFSPSSDVEVGDLILFTGSTTAHIQQRNVGSATTTSAGIVQLNDTLTSDSPTQALTANKGKFLNDNKLNIADLREKIQKISASVATNNLTVGLNDTTLEFRDIVNGSSAVYTRNVPTNISLVIPNGATLGTLNATNARIVILAIDNSGTVELAVVNAAGTFNFDESQLVSTTALSTASDSDNVVYSTSIRTNVAFRIVGFIDVNQATAGTWVTAPTLIQGAGGQALRSLIKDITGNAATSSKWQTARTISTTGDGTWSVSVDGSANASAAFTLANSGVTAGSYGTATTVPAITVDAKGRVTGVTNTNIQTASTSQAGIVQLNSATNNTSTTQAATPSAVKSAYDLAAAAIPSSQKGVANGVATLDATGIIPSSQLPSFVDDVLEYATLATFPVTGSSGKIYVALDTNLVYRWSGSTYVAISAGGGTVDAALKLATTRTIAATGDAAWSVSFDGSANVSAALTLANSGVTAGTYPKVTVDAKGRVTTGTVLLSSDIPSLDVSKLTTGTLAVGRGGTGLAASTQGGILYGATASTNAFTAAGTTNQILKSNGTGAPTWVTLDLSYMPDAAVKKSVRAATTANITLSGAQTVDGITLVAGDRVLVKDQSTASANGIYIVSATAWTRSPDADTSTKLAGSNVNVDSGTVNGGLRFDTDFKTTDTIGTTNLTWNRVVDTGLASTVVGTTPGTAAIGTSINYARADHVHPVQTTVSGNAGTATKLATARTISTTGDATWSVSFDGNANATAALTLANSGATAGSYGSGSTLDIPAITVDAKGRVTAVSNSAIRAASDIQTGVVELATSAEVIAGTDTTRVITPAVLKAAKAVHQFGGLFNIVAGTPLVITHNLNLIHRNAFTINIIDANNSMISLDVDSIDANSLTVTSYIALSNVYITIQGARA